MTKILFLVPYPLKEAPSQRFRFEQYFGALDKVQYTFHVQSFLTARNWKIFYQKGKFISKFLAIFFGYLKRFTALLFIVRYNYIFIHREVTPLGPPIVEWIIAKLFRKRIIYDFDDAIWLTDNLNESTVVRFLKWRGKVSSICQWSFKVSCGNEYLGKYATRFNKQVVINPTTIDTVSLQNQKPGNLNKKQKHVVVGWTGSHSTLKYLKSIEPVLQHLEDSYPHVSFLFIADKEPDLNLTNISFVRWNADSEITDLLQIDIGIMPLPDDEWTRGKCGFKALQYMALGIPPVVSPVGVNTKIVEHNINGFLAKTNEEWLDYLQCLVKDLEKRRSFGDAAATKVLKQYSVHSNTQNFISLFQ